MRILVTGGAGFIGSHLVEHLLRHGEELEIIDNLNDFYPREWKLQNLHEIRQTGSPAFHEVDICDAVSLNRVVERFRPHTVIHLAAEAGLRRSVLEPLRYTWSNVHGTSCVLEACKNHGVSRVLFASSSSVYGATDRVPFQESDSLVRPLSPYAATKLAGEQMCYVYSRVHEIDVICLRLFTVYGPRQRPDLAVRKFMERIDAGLPVVIYGDGSSGRDYTYVGDIVEGIAGALRYDCAFDIFNLGNARPVTLREMIQTVERVVGRKATLEQQPWNLTEAKLTWASIEKARRAFGYEPKVNLEVGVVRAFDWWKTASTAVAAAGAIAT